MLLLMKMESIEHARFRALAQIFVDKDKAVEVFEEYMKIAFPYLEATKRRGKEEAFKALESWVKQGPLGVTPIPMPKIRSKLKERIVSRDNRTRSRKEVNELYKKMGSGMPWESQPEHKHRT